MTSRHKVLMLASYFPRPQNRVMGSWALMQADALLAQGIDLIVVSLLPWLPRGLPGPPAVRSIADCPSSFAWGAVRTHYVRWPYYAKGWLRTLSFRHPLPFLEFAYASVQRSLNEIVRTFQPDLLFCHHSIPNGWVAHKLHERTGLPYVITDHSFGEIEDSNLYRDRKRVMERVVSSAAKMISVSRRMEQGVQATFPFADTGTIHNGVPDVPKELLDNPRPPELARSLVVFSAGLFYERKGFPFLIDVFADVARRFPAAHLRIAGDGIERGLTEARIEHHRLQDRVTLLGYRSPEQVRQEMVWSDLFVHLGWDEPFGMVLLEAASAAKPSVWCNDGGINDMFHSGVEGFAVPPRSLPEAVESICTLLNNETLRSQMGSNARILFKAELEDVQSARKMRDLFESVLGGDSRRNAKSMCASLNS